LRLLPENDHVRRNLGIAAPAWQRQRLHLAAPFCACRKQGRAVSQRLAERGLQGVLKVRNTARSARGAPGGLIARKFQGIK
jgi:hypothetical protein